MSGGFTSGGGIGSNTEIGEEPPGCFGCLFIIIVVVIVIVVVL